jgi:signal peptidase I
MTPSDPTKTEVSNIASQPTRPIWVRIALWGSPTRTRAMRFMWLSLALAGMSVVLSLLVAKAFFIDYYRIPQNGMYPGLPAGSVFFTAKRPYSDASRVKRGDVVVFVREENGQRYNYIWRIVALPGERIEASGASLVINGQAVERRRLREADGKVMFREHIGDISYEVAFDQQPASLPPDASVTVPADQFFVMGDNRFGARDSRYFGTISFSSIIGKQL